MSPTWLRQRVRFYAQMVGLGYVPKVVFSQKDWQRSVPKRNWKDSHGALGAALNGVVYISRQAACCRRSSDDLAAHEVLHLSQPKMRHGDKFEHYVSELRLGRVPPGVQPQ